MAVHMFSMTLFDAHHLCLCCNNVREPLESSISTMNGNKRHLFFFFSARKKPFFGVEKWENPIF